MFYDDKIWKLYTINENSTDRCYHMYKMEEETDDLRPHYGVHILDIQKIKIVNGTLELEPAIELFKERTDSIISIQEDEKYNILSDKTHLRSQLEDYCNNGKKWLYQVFLSLLDKNVPSNIIYLSDLIVLGYALDIEKLYIYDPACRPLYTTDAPASTVKRRRGVSDYRVPVEPSTENFKRID